MKRNRGELAPSDVPAKAQRRQKDSAPKAVAARSRPAVASPDQKPRKARGEEKRPAIAVPEPSPPLEAAGMVEEEGVAAAWDVGGAAELGGWWWWGVEEDKLLGWFPFGEEDFLCARGGGIFWEEEDHDIWQLQHIHEIPTTTK